MDDLGSDILGQGGGPMSGPSADSRRRVTNETLGEDDAIGASQLDGVVGGEVPAHAGDAGREQGTASVTKRLASSVVHLDGARRADGESDPELSGREASRSGPEPGAD